MKTHTDFLKEDKTILIVLKVKYFQSEKQKHRKVIKILTPKQMLQTLQMALTQIKVRNTSENLLNEIRQIIFLY